jgi:hypothetical protein
MSNPGPTLPPSALLMNLISGKFVAQAVSAAAELGLADHLGDAPKAATEVAAAMGAHAPSLQRLMRALAMVGVLVEHEGDRFALTPMGACLRSDAPGSLRAMARFMGRPWHNHVWGELAYSAKTGQSAMLKAFGKGIFEWGSERPEEVALFNDAMTSFSGLAARAVVQAYDFSGFARIADVGGGHGALLSQILAASPKAKGVLFDLPKVVAGATPLLAAAGVADRCEPVGGDFFEAVPAACDAYVMKHVLHDWDDERCVKILSLCRAELPLDGKVLVVEMLVTPPDVPSFAKLLDLEMLIISSGGKERSEREFSQLFAKAGLTLARVVPTESPVAVLEATKA